MPEIISIKRTTPYGIQLEDQSFRKTSEDVRKFLQGKTPCKAEILEAYEKEGITMLKMIAKDITPEEPKKSGGEWRTPTQLIRLDCLKAAVELLNKGSDMIGVAKLVLDLAEEFEKWVYRE